MCFEKKGIELTRRPLFTNNVTQKERLIDEVVGRTEPGKTLRMNSLLCAAFKMMNYIF
jgi:hypothetical protein